MICYIPRLERSFVEEAKHYQWFQDFVLLMNTGRMVYLHPEFEISLGILVQIYGAFP